MVHCISSRLELNMVHCISSRLELDMVHCISSRLELDMVHCISSRLELDMVHWTSNTNVIQSNLSKLNLFGTEEFVQFRQVFGLHRFKLHRYLGYGAVTHGSV